MKIVNIEVLRRFVLKLSFDDGSTGTVDLEDLRNKGIFRAWEKPGVFESVSVGSGGEASWDCGADLCADALYMKATGKTPSEIFPMLAKDSRCA